MPVRWCAESWWWRWHAWLTAIADPSDWQPPRTSDDQPTLPLVLVVVLVVLVLVAVVCN